MKITPEHYNHMKQAIEAFEAEHAEKCTAHKQAHSGKRYRWDVMRAAGLTMFLCDVLYNYVNDDHIDTALRKITGTN